MEWKTFSKSSEVWRRLVRVAVSAGKNIGFRFLCRLSANRLTDKFLNASNGDRWKFSPASKVSTRANRSSAEPKRN